MNIEIDGTHLLDILPGAGVVLNEIVPLMKAVCFMISRGGKLDPPHGALAIGGDVLVSPELVARQERSYAEIEEQAPGVEYGQVVQLVPAGAAASVVAGEKLTFGISLVSAILQAGEEQGFIQDFSKPGLETPAIIAGAVMERRVVVVFVQAITEFIEAEDARAIGKMHARDDIVAVIVEIAAGLLYDLDYTSADSDQTSCPALNFITGALRPRGRGGGNTASPVLSGGGMLTVITSLFFQR